MKNRHRPPHLTPDPTVTLEQSATTEPRKTSWKVFAIDVSPLRDSRELTGLQRPALDALTPRLVRAEAMPAVAALQGLRGSIAMIAGPAIGGVLVVSVGPAVAYSVDLVSFLISVWALSLMQSVPPPPDADRPSLRSVIEGLRYARSRQELLGTYLIDMNAMFFGMPMALFPAIAEFDVALTSK